MGRGIAIALLVVLLALEAIVFGIAAVLVAFGISGTRINALLVVSWLLAAGFGIAALRQLRDLEDRGDGWLSALALTAVAYVTLVISLVVLAFSHPMG